MRKRLLFFSIFAFLSISFNLMADGNGSSSKGEPCLRAALCEMVAWQAPDRATRDSLLLAKAAYLSEAGESERAYETVCRIPRFGQTDAMKEELLRCKLVYAWEAGKMDDFQVLLSEAAETSSQLNPAESPLAAASQPSGKPRHRSADAAMLLSIVPGLGCAYAGDWPDAGKYLLLQGGSIALGVGAFVSGLYLGAFLGGGMLLYTTLPPATARAVSAAEDFNQKALKEYYRPVYEDISGVEHK